MKNINFSCPLCNSVGGELIISDPLFRVVHVLDPDYPGYIRLIINEHVKEMTDLSAKSCQEVFATLIMIEQVLRDELNPYKINIASLGNMTPHIHWHIIPRYINDKHFPNPIWGVITHSTYIPPKVNIINLHSAILKRFETKS